MVVCPVCDHPQSGRWECELCGRPLSSESAAGPAIPPLDGLEPTGQLAVLGADGESVPGLEPTRLGPVDAPAPPIPDIEPTRAAPVDELPTATLPDLELPDGISGDEPTPYPAVLTCRYCRTEAALGERICSRCGMRLPTADPPAAAPEPEEARGLCSCGAPIRGPRCPSCGARN